MLNLASVWTFWYFAEQVCLIGHDRWKAALSELWSYVKQVVKYAHLESFVNELCVGSGQIDSTTPSGTWYLPSPNSFRWEIVSFMPRIWFMIWFYVQLSDICSRRSFEEAPWIKESGSLASSLTDARIGKLLGFIKGCSACGMWHGEARTRTFGKGGFSLNGQRAKLQRCELQRPPESSEYWWRLLKMLFPSLYQCSLLRYMMSSRKKRLNDISLYYCM